MWPPSNIRAAARYAATEQDRLGIPTVIGATPTFSWLYMPLILDALGLSMVFPFTRPANWERVVAVYAAAFQQHGITWADEHERYGDGLYHLHADRQEALLAMVPVAAGALTEYAWELVQAGASRPLNLIDGFEEWAAAPPEALREMMGA